MTLFDLELVTTEMCRFPQVAGATAYRYGCRCDRCREAKAFGLSSMCHIDGCNGIRLKGRRVCTDHLARCAESGCLNPRRLVQAAKYCEEHATSINKDPQGPARVVGICHLCDTRIRHTPGSIGLCQEHKHLRSFVRQCRGHHLTREQTQVLMAVHECWICGGDLAWRFHQFARANESIHVDHDHRHCPGQKSCGQCVRGLAHANCNQQFAYVEKFIDRIGEERLHAILGSRGRWL